MKSNYSIFFLTLFMSTAHLLQADAISILGSSLAKIAEARQSKSRLQINWFADESQDQPYAFDTSYYEKKHDPKEGELDKLMIELGIVTKAEPQDNSLKVEGLLEEDTGFGGLADVTLENYDLLVEQEKERLAKQAQAVKNAQEIKKNSVPTAEELEEDKKWAV